MCRSVRRLLEVLICEPQYEHLVRKVSFDDLLVLGVLESGVLESVDEVIRGFRWVECAWLPCE
jgi:hypothetical protein